MNRLHHHHPAIVLITPTTGPGFCRAHRCCVGVVVPSGSELNFTALGMRLTLFLILGFPVTWGKSARSRSFHIVHLVPCRLPHCRQEERRVEPVQWGPAWFSGWLADLGSFLGVGPRVGAEDTSYQWPAQRDVADKDGNSYLSDVPVGVTQVVRVTEVVVSIQDRGDDLPTVSASFFRGGMQEASQALRTLKTPSPRTKHSMTFLCCVSPNIATPRPPVIPSPTFSLASGF